MSICANIQICNNKTIKIKRAVHKDFVIGGLGSSLKSEVSASDSDSDSDDRSSRDSISALGQILYV